MSEPEDFLKFLFNEPIYVIEEDGEKESTSQEQVEEPIVENPEDKEPKEPTLPIANEQKKQASKNDILILFDNPSDKHLEPSELEYLKKILGAINKSVDHIDFMNVALESPRVEGYAHVISFTPNHKLSIDRATIQYTAVSFSGSQLIVADALKNISASTDLRKKLWEVLKKMFVE